MFQLAKRVMAENYASRPWPLFKSDALVQIQSQVATLDDFWEADDRVMVPVRGMADIFAGLSEGVVGAWRGQRATSV